MLMDYRVTVCVPVTRVFPLQVSLFFNFYLYPVDGNIRVLWQLNRGWDLRNINVKIYGNHDGDQI